MGVRHVANNDGTVTQFDDETGQELVTFPDPDGSFTRDHIEPAAASAAQPAPSGSNLARLHQQARDVAPPAPVLPDVSTVKPRTTESDFKRALALPHRPTEEPAAPAAPAPAAPAPGGIPVASLPVAGQETAGLSEPDRAARAEARTRVGEAQQTANVATTEAEQQQLAAREERVRAESDRALGRFASDLELHELAKQKVLESEEFAKQARATPIEPGQALAGPKFFYAIMAGVGAQLSKFGSALLGQQDNRDTNLVDDIVDASVRQQLADRGLKVEGAQDQVDAARKEALRLSIQANASLEKWFDAQAQVETSPEVRAAYASHSDERRSAIERDQFQLAEKEWNTAVQHQAVPKPVKGAGPDLRNAETKEDQAALLANGVDKKSYAKYADERLKTGADVTLKHISDVRQIVKDLKEKGSTDVPGVGPIDQNVQALLRSNDASKVQQALGMVVTTFVKSRSGAAVTDKEREYLTKIIQGTGSNQEQSLESGLRSVESEVNQQLEVLNNGRSGEERAFRQIQSNRRGRVQLSDEQKKNRDAQLAPKAEPKPRAAPAAPADFVEATPENVAEFNALPANSGLNIRPSSRRKRSSREDELRQLLED